MTTTSPEIEIRWDGQASGWRKCHKTVVRPTVVAALETAKQGLSTLEVPVNGKRRLTLYRAVSTACRYGEADDNGRDFYLYISVDDIKRQKVAQRLAELSCTTFHELLHTVRLENVKKATLSEQAVTEGIAICGTELFAARMELGIYMANRIAAVRAESPAYIERFRKQLQKDDEVASAYTNQQIYSKWFGDETGASYYGYELSFGELVGIAAVDRLLTHGQTLAGILKIPTQEILAA